MSDLNEFAVNLPMTSVGPITATASPSFDITAAQEIPPDVSPECSHITVSVDSATVTSFDVNDPCVTVDLVLNVCACDTTTGNSKSYKLVKRLCMDKIKLALQAETTTPHQVVEHEDDPEEVSKIMREFYAAKRARELTGLPESKGDRKFTIMFSYDDSTSETPARASRSLVVSDVKDAAHARHVFNTHHAPKYKNPKITRAVEMKSE